MSNNFQRLFFIFKNMDNDSVNPSGYIKIEINGDNAKIQTSINNLSNRQDLKYELYGIIKDEKELRYTSICDIQHVNGRADIRVDADCHKIGSNELNFDEINIFAVIARNPQKGAWIRYPLVAYKKEELDWRRDFETSLSGSTRSIPDIIAESAIEVQENSEVPVQYNEEMEERVPEEEVIPGQFDLDGNDRNQGSEAEAVSEGAGFETESGVIWPAANEPEGQEYRNENAAHEGINSIIGDDLASKFESVLTSIYSGDKAAYSDAALSQAENDVLSSAQRDFEEISSINHEDERLKPELDMQSLKEELDKSFEICSPFKMKSKRFKWWKINSPGYLNNILFRSNVKTYLLFNPKVMLAHYKYRYIIFGVRSDRNTGRERLICGVPGIYSIDENPFGNLGSWAQLEGYKPKYGAFGYWLILIDPRTGKLIKIK